MQGAANVGWAGLGAQARPGGQCGARGAAQAAERACRGQRAHSRHCARQGETAQTGSALRYRRSAQTELVIQTQQGDTVRLQIGSSDSLGARGAASATQISFSVEGDLNPDELKAIQDVVGQAGALAEQFFSGDLSSAFAAAQTLAFDPAQLARASLEFDVREQLAAPQTAVAAAPAPVDAAPSPAAAPGNDGSADPLASITDFLRQLRGALALPAGPADANAAPGPVESTLKLKIFQSVLSSMAADRASSPEQAPAVPGIVSDTLDALDAHTRPPLDAVA